MVAACELDNGSKSRDTATTSSPANLRPCFEFIRMGAMRDTVAAGHRRWLQRT
jgi:hypothetical protein